MAVYIWAATVSLSRVLIGRHLMFEVIGGVLVGALNYAFIRSVWLDARHIIRLYN
jgi:membrane-associated phospholipid phosphatase